MRTGCKEDEFLSVETGVKQSSVLFPLLFIANTVRVIRKVKEEVHAGPGLLEQGGGGGANIYNGLCGVFGEGGFEMNVEKMVIMIVCRKEGEDIE